MFINRIARQLLADKGLRSIASQLREGEDATLSVSQSGRNLVLASLWAADPRPCLYVVSGEEAADRAAHALSAWLGLEHVMRYPERRDRPWNERIAPDMAQLGSRTRAMAALAEGKTVTLADILCAPKGGRWRFQPAPPRKRRNRSA